MQKIESLLATIFFNSNAISLFICLLSVSFVCWNDINTGFSIQLIFRAHLPCSQRKEQNYSEHWKQINKTRHSIGLMNNVVHPFFLIKTKT